ncbi:recombinase family protein [Aliiruegeria lutimaris]|uniref:Site-specific DNA recombinase n=1 Tax=Aliiruegeria lutimaris TaxID=571298 RepID=A0A1G9J455_9RHOB|nr:recombinase family protein [Aliiruegeria lutimaris]SDL32036.1 Site-specific DNA recombinase [Aliiruegeria lutimaris]
MARVGYRRVSTYDQNLDRQDLGEVDQLFEEKESGGTAERPALLQLITYVRAGDEVVVWSIDRLARDLRDLQDLIAKITDKGAKITFLSEQLTFGPEGEDPFAKLQLQMMGAFAEFERAIIRKRQADGIAKAKARGVYAGGKRQIDRGRVIALRDAGQGPSAIANEMGISRMSVHRILKAEDEIL